MLARLCIIPVILVLAACQHLEQTIVEVTAPEVAGAWAREQPGVQPATVLVLDPGGGFGIVGSDVVGRWEVDDYRLVVAVAQVPTSRVERTRLTIGEVTESTLDLVGEGPLAGHLRRVDAQVGHLEVTARYPDKIPLPPDAVVTIEVADVSRADAPSKPLAQIRVAGGGLASPMKFHLHFLRKDVDPRMAYSVSARITIAKRVWMRTTTAVHALTRGAPDKVELRLHGVPLGTGAGGPASIARATGAAATEIPGTAELPATFTGAGGALVLMSDGTFRQRSQAVDDVRAGYDLGRWELHGDRLVLRGGAEVPKDYRWLEGDRLQPVNPRGEPIGDPSAVLEPASYDPVAGPIRILGLVTYLADAARIEECLTGRSYPVALERDWPTLERAYLSQRPGPGEPLLADMDASFEERPLMEGPGSVPTVVIEKFNRVLPGEACRPARADASLANTFWRLLVVDDQVVLSPADSAQPAHLRFSADGRVNGSGGCNRFSGGYEAEGRRLEFAADMASTLMACGEPADATERAFLEALEATARYGISGDRLDLYASDGSHLAHFQATWFR